MTFVITATVCCWMISNGAESWSRLLGSPDSVQPLEMQCSQQPPPGFGRGAHHLDVEKLLLLMGVVADERIHFPFSEYIPRKMTLNRLSYQLACNEIVFVRVRGIKSSRKTTIKGKKAISI